MPDPKPSPLSNVLAGLSPEAIRAIALDALKKGPSGQVPGLPAKPPRVNVRVTIAPHKEIAAASAKDGASASTELLGASLSPSQIKELRAMETQVLAHLQADPANHAAFVADPLGALAKAKILGKDTIRMLSKISAGQTAVRHDFGPVQLETIRVAVKGSK